MRRLELENGRLEQQVSSIEETNTREVTSVRNMYDKELSQVNITHVTTPLYSLPNPAYALKIHKLLPHFITHMAGLGGKLEFFNFDLP